MIKVIFKSLEKSQLAQDIVNEKFERFVQKFPELMEHKIDVFLSMENSVTKAGKDVFGVKVIITGKKYTGIVIEKKSSNLYSALDELLLVLLESLNRKGDKARVRNRNVSRKQKVALAV